MSFATATRDELWVYGRLVERRLAHGVAHEDAHGIRASDARSDALVDACDVAIEELRAFVADDLRVYLVADANEADGVTRTIIVTIGDRSVVTSPDHFAHDVALLRNAPRGDAELRALPFVWLHGTAAVLLHEMVGHPLEHGQAAVTLPSWLRVDVPLKTRRASFKDIPLQRMTNVTATQYAAPFAMPHERIEIVLVDGGAYDPLTEMVTLRIASARIVEGDRTRALAPFTISETRQSLAQSIVGASGETLRYPGVICSREGQELVVGSYAPLLVTESR